MTRTASTTEEESLTSKATSQVESAASTAQEKAVELKDEGKTRLSDELDKRTTDAGSQARSFAEALRKSGNDLRTQGKSQPAGLADGVAERMERLGGYLEHTSGDRLLRDVENLARRQPWMIAGIGLVAGLAASRFLKASSERRYGANAQSGQPSNQRSPSYGSATASADTPLARESYVPSG